LRGNATTYTKSFSRTAEIYSEFNDVVRSFLPAMAAGGAIALTFSGTQAGWATKLNWEFLVG
jgi:hypothetical protein